MRRHPGFTHIQILICGVLAFLMFAPSARAAWQEVLNCGVGQALVKSDTSDKTRIQLVVHDTSANHFINLSQMDPTTRSADDTETTFVMKQTGDIFSSSGGAFAESQQSYNSLQARQIDSDYMTKYTNHVQIYNDGTGLKLEFTRTAIEVCSFYDPSSGTCVGGRTYSVRDRFVGNWFFPICQPTTSK